MRLLQPLELLDLIVRVVLVVVDYHGRTGIPAPSLENDMAANPNPKANPNQHEL